MIKMTRSRKERSANLFSIKVKAMVGTQRREKNTFCSGNDIDDSFISILSEIFHHEL